MKRFLLSALLLMGVATGAEAKNLCVNTSGNDSNTYAANSAGSNVDGTGTSCWATVYRAARGVAVGGGADNTAQAAQAGDTVYVGPGNYFTPPGENDRWAVVHNPANSGTAGNPITFVGSGNVYLGHGAGTGGSPIMGASSRNYITWDHFRVFEANGLSHADTGPVVVHDGTGNVIKNCYIDGNGNGHGAVDNHPGIRIEDATDTVIRNNEITNTTTLHNPNNGPGIQMYGNVRTIIENNYIHDNDAGIFVKGGPWTVRVDGNTIRYNKITNCQATGGAVGIATYAGAPSTALVPTKIYQNVIENCESGARVWFLQSANFDEPYQNHFVNNTIISGTNGVQGVEVLGGLSTGTGNSVWNNLISGFPHGLGSDQTTVLQDQTTLDFEHNVYASISGGMMYINGGGTTLTLAQWAASPYFQDATTPAANSTAPTFVNAASGDYRLCTGVGVPTGCGAASANLTTGRVTQSIGGTDGATIPVGAYITNSETIGLTSGATVPDAPTIGTATAGNAQCTVTFTPPGNDGGATITGYTATSSPSSLTGTASSSPITVTGLTNGTPYTFTVYATNSQGNSTASSASGSCTPANPGASMRKLRLRGE